MLSRQHASAYALVAYLVACGTGTAATPGASVMHPDEPDAGGASDAAVMVAARAPTPIRRLSGTEYDNTVRDLVGAKESFSSTFPIEASAERGTNIAAELTVSPALRAAYEAAAEQLAKTALANPKIVTCDPARIGRKACATQILSRFARRAWRRPVTSSELDALVGLVPDAETPGTSFTVGLEAALKATLSSVSFLFHVESDPDPTSPAAHPLDEYELASRLSYLLWTTMPDDVLFAYAEAGKLSEAATFDKQVTRMLADPRATSFADELASQWLLRTLPSTAPDATLFPTFDEDLRASMTAETRAVLASFLFEDLDFLDIVDAPFTFVDGRLADYYGIPGITGTRLIKVPLWPGTHRGGLLTQASVLTMTAKPTRSSPDRRGEWILAELLCAPIPSQPRTDPVLEADASVSATRQSLRAEANNPTCATCHASIDSYGFTLEHYDAVGRWRGDDQGTPIDATGNVPGGTTLDGAAALAITIKADVRFPACATRKLVAYAFGRAPTAEDEPTLATLSATFVQGGHRMRDLIIAIVRSDMFRTRHGGM